jgi:hypothetical protein
MDTFMQVFEIEFFANDVSYRARVHKIPSDSELAVEYHVFNISPQIPNAPRTFMFIFHPDEGTFDCTIFNDDAELSQNIFTSIKRFCLENQIQLT